MSSPIIDELVDRFRGAWRFRWLALGLACAIAFAGWVAVFALPDEYEASARVFVDTRTALKPALQGLAPEQDVSAQLNYVRQSLLKGPQLEAIARQSGVIPASITDPRVAERMLDRVSDRTFITVRSASEGEDQRNGSGSVYGISYRDSDRSRSLRVVTLMLSTLIDQTLGGKRADAENAQKFLEDQIKDYEGRLHTAEERLADFKKRNLGLMPTEQGGYFAELQQETDALAKTKTSLATAVARRTELSRELRGDVAISVGAPGAGPAGTPPTDTVARIAETQQHLDELLLKFTDKHPDVIAARQTLVELKARRETEIESLKRGDPNAVAATGASSNPVYQSTALALTQTDVEIAALRAELEQHQNKAAELHRMLNVAPQVEAEFAQLNRDYDVNKAQYTALLQNYEKARMGEKAENAGSVRFEVVEPPTADFAPVWPPRIQLLAFALLVALACGVGLAMLLHRLWPVVGSARSLEQLTNVPLLGVVSSAFPGADQKAARRDLLILSTVTACLVLAFAVVLVLNHVGLRLSVQALGRAV
ncbi:MAG TPA: XrtA system polysaccharide chain length determinant [Steroidobacteraceae bacterium]|jgi:polysaccharide chain length determinant protein (PEP-CTERM system associated)|nr:XrtA system polysaccharide chain length determinant [Steroidobacteraceae bacterium]